MTKCKICGKEIVIKKDPKSRVHSHEGKYCQFKCYKKSDRYREVQEGNKKEMEGVFVGGEKISNRLYKIDYRGTIIVWELDGDYFDDTAAVCNLYYYPGGDRLEYLQKVLKEVPYVVFGAYSYALEGGSCEEENVVRVAMKTLVELSDTELQTLNEMLPFMEGGY